MASLAVMSLIMTAGASTVSALGTYRMGQAERQAADYRAAVAGNNAVIANQNAELELQRGRIEEGQQREKTAQLIGAQRAGYAAAGVEIDRGTPGRVQESTAQLGELDALTVRNNAMRRSYAYRTQATNLESEAQLEKMAGRQAMEAAKIGAFSSLISGASSTSSKWQAYKDKGLIK